MRGVPTKRLRQWQLSFLVVHCQPLKLALLISILSTFTSVNKVRNSYLSTLSSIIHIAITMYASVNTLAITQECGSLSQMNTPKYHLS